MYAGVVPLITGYVFYRTDVSCPLVIQHPVLVLWKAGIVLVRAWVLISVIFFEQGKYDMRGKLRGDTISEW